MQEPYRLGSLGDLVELLVDGWEITGMHYSETCADLDVPEGKAAAFVSLMRPDAGAQGLFIPDDERTFSHRALLAVFRESPHIWKYRNPDTIHARLAELATTERPDPESWQDVPDPADVRLDVSPSTLQGVVALGGQELAMSTLRTIKQVSEKTNGNGQKQGPKKPGAGDASIADQQVAAAETRNVNRRAG